MYLGVMPINTGSDLILISPYLKGLQHLTLKCNEDLHAKCYVNGDKMIITSMNLYQFSMDHNKEMGILLEKSDPADVRPIRGQNRIKILILAGNKYNEHQPVCDESFSARAIIPGHQSKKAAAGAAGAAEDTG